MSGLKDLRWTAVGDIVFDLSQFSLLNELCIRYNKCIIGWETMEHLKKLQLSNVKTDNLMFLKGMTGLERLRIIRGSFTSIEGLEDCVNLKMLFLQCCSSLTSLKPTIGTLHNLEQLNLECCKKLDVKRELEDVVIKRISVL